MYVTMTRNNDITCRRWTDPGAEGEKEHRYKTFIPENVDERAGSSDSPLDAPENRKRKAKQPTDKGALYHEYDTNVHEWITHLRRVHYKNPSVMIGGKAVQACDPLAPVGQVLYYTHSRTDFYNSFFFEWWDACFAATFKYTCPFLTVESTTDLTNLLDARFET